jgi:multiple sugar transport system ATP-binding protein
MDLRLQNLRKSFGDRLAVDIPSLNVGAGEFFTFVGPSGCGKSTTLNLIAGLETPTTGQLWLGDRLLNDLPPHKRDIAFVFQSYALYPHRTVAENLAFPLTMAKMPREEIHRRTAEAAAALGLAPLLGKYPRQLSGGERQRVALGRAIVRKPSLFLFDEPLSNLDAPLRVQTRKELKRLHQQLGTTFLYVTHDQEEALSLSDRIAVMRSGTIQQCGPPDEIYYSPANRFVASFFGSPPMNFLEGRIQLEEGVLWVELEENRIPLSDSDSMSGVSLANGASVVVGIRPEDLRLSREITFESGAESKEAWPGRITLTELHGAQTYVELTSGAQTFTVVAPAHENFRTSETVWITLARVHLFRPQSEHPKSEQRVTTITQ